MRQIVILAILLAIVFAGFGNAVLYLWNWLMPAIFGLRAITYWQAVGLMGLSWILFGGLRGFGKPVPLRHRSRKTCTAQRQAQP